MLPFLKGSLNEYALRLILSLEPSDFSAVGANADSPLQTKLVVAKAGMLKRGRELRKVLRVMLFFMMAK